MDNQSNENKLDLSEHKDEQAESQWQECKDNELAWKRDYKNKAEMDFYTDAQGVYARLSSINVNPKSEKKNGLTYLSWAWAHAEVKKEFPDVNYKIYENNEGWNYHHDNKTGWVKVGAIIKGLEYIEYLPIMDYKNKSIPVDKITSFDVNKAIQRAKTKAVALHGLGLYIYAGEDLPEDSKEQKELKQLKSLYFEQLTSEYGFNIPNEIIEKARTMTLDDFKKAVNK
tara:strand:- start:4019 stop:4699 length:681 start_codon:yes stop_codon:yes gene_type:complete